MRYRIDVVLKVRNSEHDSNHRIILYRTLKTEVSMDKDVGNIYHRLYNRCIY